MENYAYVKQVLEDGSFDVNRIDATQLDHYLSNGYVVASEDEWVADSTPVEAEAPVEATEEVVSEEAPAEEVAEVEA